MNQTLAVDVLIIGAGIPALYIAQALQSQYHVCVVSEPGVPYESYESAGRFGAGYTGDDVARVGHARRAARWWREWAQSHDVPCESARSVHVLPPDDNAHRTRLWADVGLSFTPFNDVRATVNENRERTGGKGTGRAGVSMLDGGGARNRPTYVTPDDVVMDPAVVAARLRAGIEDRIIAGEVQRFGLITEQAVDFVELCVPGVGPVSVTPRFVVLASDVANASLLYKLALSFKDRNRRREAVEVARASQAVRRCPTIAIRGELPPAVLHVDGIDVTSHPVGGDSDEVVWLVELPFDDGVTVVGPEDVRFDAPLDHKVVGEGLDRLFELSPALRKQAPFLLWSTWVARRTVHPIMVPSDPSVRPPASPAPACIETLGMDAAMAAWPSHLSFTTIVGDLVVDRVRHALGVSTPSDGPAPASLARPAAPTTQDRWLRADHAWETWGTFTSQLDYERV